MLLKATVPRERFAAMLNEYAAKLVNGVSPDVALDEAGKALEAMQELHVAESDGTWTVTKVEEDQC